ncbi:MAG: prolyl oligopeptidase family serine peptidase [Pseudomonadota bacterium]
MRALAVLLFVLAGMAAGMAAALPAAACGPDTDCMIGERSYRISLPDKVGPVTGALVYAHGYRGSSKGAMRNKAMRALASELGVALVAADAGVTDDWQIPGVPRNRDTDGGREFSYFAALIDDLADRHGLDRERMIMTGFSAGGMMVWELACKRRELFLAYIPIAGTHWAPVPESCTAPVGDLVHIHGTGDKIVPIDGRRIANTRQGRVPLALARTIAEGGFGAPVQSESKGLDCATRQNASGEIMAFCTHPGGHSIKMDYLRRALEILGPRGF